MMVDEVARIAVQQFVLYYTNLLHTGDTKEADNSTDNIMCKTF